MDLNSKAKERGKKSPKRPITNTKFQRLERQFVPFIELEDPQLVILPNYILNIEKLICFMGNHISELQHKM